MFLKTCLNFIVTGLPTAVNNSSTTHGDHNFENFVGLPGTAPPPPVPPRSRRSVERSPSAVNTYSSTVSSNIHSNAGSRKRLTSKKMEAERMNGDSSNPNIPNPVTNSIQPQHLQNMNAMSSGQIMQEQMLDNGMMEAEQEKENINNLQISDNTNHIQHDENHSNGENGNSEVEQKISVKERMQKFNRIASESELFAGGLNAKASSSRNRREIATKV